MSTEITTALPELAARINHEHEQVWQSMTQGLAHALEAGRLLIEAKGALPHGEWLPWIEANTTVSERTAQAYMRLSREWPKLDDAKAQRVADLPFRQVMRLLADPGESVESKAEPSPADGAGDDALKAWSDKDAVLREWRALVDADDVLGMGAFIGERLQFWDLVIAMLTLRLQDEVGEDESRPQTYTRMRTAAHRKRTVQQSPYWPILMKAIEGQLHARATAALVYCRHFGDEAEAEEGAAT